MVALEVATWMTTRFWYEILSAFGYGVASSIVPVLNSEIFLVGALATGLVGPVSVSVGLALGHTLGKLVIFLAIRRGSQLRWFTPKEKKPPMPGSWRERWQRWNARSAYLVEDPRWGTPILLISSISGVPPIYLVTVYAATTRMKVWWFSICVTVGFFLRCLSLALITKWGVHLAR